LNKFAGSAGILVGTGDQASGWYAFVGWGPSQGSALLTPNATEKRRTIDEAGIAKILKPIADEEATT